MKCQVENPMIKDCLWPEPCRSKSPSFKEFVEEELALDDLLGDTQIMEILIKKYHDRYQEWLQEIS